MTRDGLKQPRVHRFPTTGEAYDASQTSDEIRNGDVLSVPTELAVAVMIEAWPTAVSEKYGEFEELADRNDFDWEKVPTTASGYKEYANYGESFKLAIDELNHICMQDADRKWVEDVIRISKNYRRETE